MDTESVPEEEPQNPKPEDGTPYNPHRDAYGSETYGHGEVDNYVEPRRPKGPSQDETLKLARALLWRKIALVALSLAVLAMAVGIFYTVYLIRQQQLANTPLTQQTHTAAIQAKKAAERGREAAIQARRSADRIENCTTPGRDCYLQGQREAALWVGDINEVITLSISCADQPGQQSLAEVQRCVHAGLVKMPLKTGASISGYTGTHAKSSTSSDASYQSPRKPAAKHTPAPAPKPSAGTTPSPTPASTPTPQPLLCVVGICLTPSA